MDVIINCEKIEIVKTDSGLLVKLGGVKGNKSAESVFYRRAENLERENKHLRLVEKSARQLITLLATYPHITGKIQKTIEILKSQLDIVK